MASTERDLTVVTVALAFFVALGMVGALIGGMIVYRNLPIVPSTINSKRLSELVRTGQLVALSRAPDEVALSVLTPGGDDVVFERGGKIAWTPNPPPSLLYELAARHLSVRAHPPASATRPLEHLARSLARRLEQSAEGAGIAMFFLSAALYVFSRIVLARRSMRPARSV
jgi:hypothetical protein